MTSLNPKVSDHPSYRRMDSSPPEPNLPLSDRCSVVMNGRHAIPDNTGQDEGGHCPAETKLASAGDKEPSNAFLASSADEESDPGGEPESSTHLLQDRESTSCTRNKIAGPKVSPGRKPPTHPGVHHRPLGPSPHTTSFLAGRRGLVCLLLGAASVLLLVSSLTIVVVFGLSGGCTPANPRWQDVLFYEVFPASFQDSDGDGFGDMRGVLDRLDYIRGLGAGVVLLNSIFSALDYPLEYQHVIDFANLDPHLGPMQDFRDLVKGIHDRGMKLVLDINPTMTSDQHTWAAHWLLHRPGPYGNFYVNDTEGAPLESKGAAPHRTFGSRLFLNWSEPLLRFEMRQTLDHWLAEGVDGFWIRHLADMRVVDTNHIIQVLHEWRTLLSRHALDGTRRLLLLSHEDCVSLRANLRPPAFSVLSRLVDLVGAGLPLSRNGSAEESGPQRVAEFWAEQTSAPPVVWGVGGSETTRLGSRLGSNATLAAMFLLVALPGSFSCFYGDEIGIRESFDAFTLEVFRGGQLAPMPWSSAPRANFTSPESEPWLPLNPGYPSRNVAHQVDSWSLLTALAQLKQHSSRSTATSRLGPNEWRRGPSGLMTAGNLASGLAAVANVGAEAVVLAAELSTDWTHSGVDVLAATDPLLKEAKSLRGTVLYPGNAILARRTS